MKNHELIEELNRWRSNYSNLRVWVDTPERWSVITSADLVEERDSLIIINGVSSGPAYSCEDIDRLVEFLSSYEDNLEVVLNYDGEELPVTIFVTGSGDLLISSCEID